MAQNQTRRIAPAVLQADRQAHAALQAVAGYAPANPAFSLTNIQNLRDQMEAEQAAEAEAQAAAMTARDVATAAEWAYHNGVLGAKEQVIAQFGKDSTQVQALGLKRKSEYKAPTKKTGGATK